MTATRLLVDTVGGRGLVSPEAHGLVEAWNELSRRLLPNAFGIDPAVAIEVFGPK